MTNEHAGREGVALTEEERIASVLAAHSGVAQIDYDPARRIACLCDPDTQRFETWDAYRLHVASHLAAQPVPAPSRTEALEDVLRRAFWNPDNGGQWSRIAAEVADRILRDAQPTDGAS